MALELHLDSIDHLDESLKGFYKESDKGGFILDVNGYQDPDPNGLKTAFEKQKAAAKQSKEELSNLKQTLRDLENKYSGIDPEKVKSLLAKLENDDEAKLLAEGKIDEVVKRRIEKQIDEYERKITTASQAAEQANSKATKFENRVLENNIRSAAIEAGLHKHAIDDAIFRAKTLFALNDDGQAVQVDGSGEITLGKDGKTPYSVKDWLEEMKEKAPHWYPADNTGGGGQGNKGKTGAAQDFSKLSPRERLLAARQSKKT